MKNIGEILSKAIEVDTLRLAVVCAHDEEVLLAVQEAYEKNIIKPILIGNVENIIEISEHINFELSNFTLINASTAEEASELAVRMIHNNEADYIMKGLLDTSIILKAVLNKDFGLRTGNVLSHVAVLELSTIDRLLYLTDGAMNMYPDALTKKQIIENAVQVAHALENQCPKVGLLAAIEKYNPKMPATVDAKELVELYENGEITGCIVGGPYALDNAISIEAAHHKGMTDEMAGLIDILVVPQIESGNVLYKSAIYFAKAQAAGIIMGAKVPIVLTSRSDSNHTKLNSIALGALIANKNREV